MDDMTITISGGGQMDAGGPRNTGYMDKDDVQAE